MSPNVVFGFCVYCGAPVKERRWPTAHRPIVCRSHADLVERDPKYVEPDQWALARR